MVSTSVLKKFIVPMVYVAEWVLFFYVFLCIVAFNIVNFANLLLLIWLGRNRLPLQHLSLLL